MSFETSSLHIAIRPSPGSKPGLKEKIKRLENDLDHDPLTGLDSRRFFYRFLEHASHHRGPVLVAVADLNQLKKINDIDKSHRTGDRALIVAATALRLAFSEEDCVARVGGDEFGVIAPLRNKNFIPQNLIDSKIRSITSLLQKFDIHYQSSFAGQNLQTRQLIYSHLSTITDEQFAKVTRTFIEKHDEITVSEETTGLPSISLSIGVVISPEQPHDLNQAHTLADKLAYEMKEEHIKLPTGPPPKPPLLE